ncbi:hypothetical protein [Sphingobium sp.]|uniref:hypothetical protein n=1 Tax=Sphingobium sp. TaxID=1912891 RepID=UPI00262075D4|nr:hypothetical protein [Sphingobium sp.]
MTEDREMIAAPSHTPGPWAWFGTPNNMYLATTHSGRRYVMGFRRVGMQGAGPVFQVNGRMVKASELCRFAVGDNDVIGMTAAKSDETVYRYDICGIAHADACLIAAAPDLLEAARHLIEVGEFCRTDDTESALRELRAAILKAEVRP